MVRNALCLTMQNWCTKWKVSMSGCLMSLPSSQTNKPHVFQDYLLWDIFISLFSLCFQVWNQLWNALIWSELKENKQQKEPKELPQLWIAFLLWCILWAGWNLPLAQFPRGNNAVPMETSEQNLLIFLALNLHFQEVQLWNLMSGVSKNIRS